MKAPAHHRITLCCLLVILVSCSADRDTARISRYDSGEWGSYALWEPPGPARGLVFFFSAAGGFQAADKDAADALIQLGAAVAFVNTDTYLSRIDQSPDLHACLYLPGAVEWTMPRSILIVSNGKRSR